MPALQLKRTHLPRLSCVLALISSFVTLTTNIIALHKHFPSHGITAPNKPRSPRCRGFTITRRHTTVGRTPLDKVSADAKTSTWQHTQYSQQTPMPPVGFDTPQSVGLLWTRDQLTQRPLPDNTQHSQQTDTHASGGIRTRNPSKRAAADPRLRPRGHWDRLCYIYRDWHYTRNRLIKHPFVTSTDSHVSTLHHHRRCFLHQNMIGSRLRVYCFILQYYVCNYPIKKASPLNVSMKYLCSSILLLIPTAQSSCGLSN